MKKPSTSKRTKAPRKTVTAEQFKARLDSLLEDWPARIWLLRSEAGRVEVVFSAGEAQGLPVINFDHHGGFYLMGENVPDQCIPVIHKWFLEFTRDNFTPHRLERHFIDTRQRTFYETGRRYRDELLMHVPFVVHTKDEDSRP